MPPRPRGVVHSHPNAPRITIWLTPHTGLLVLKGDALLVIGVMSGVEDLSEEARNELAKQIGAIAAGRM